MMDAKVSHTGTLFHLLVSTTIDVECNYTLLQRCVKREVDDVGDRPSSPCRLCGRKPQLKSTHFSL